jgi:HD-GYP domain-containing protein (c-di-GMP phosphodiesterase class II)
MKKRDWASFTLLRTFSLLSAIILALIALVLANGLQGMLDKVALQQESSLAVGEAQTMLHAGLLTRAASGTLSHKDVWLLTDYSQHYMGYLHDVRVKIWSPNGTILYSDAAAAIGKRFPVDSDLARVLHGQVSSAATISDLTDAENVTEHGIFTHLLEVYVPIAGKGSQVAGAYEVYHDLSLLDAQQATIRRSVWFSVGLGFLVLYVSLFFVVRRASRRLVRQDVENKRLLEQNANLFAERETLYLATLDAMARAIDARDPYTAGHSHRVASYAVSIGEKLNLDADAILSLQRGGVLHDIGKIGVSDAILRKPGPLTAEERADMNRHPEIGYALLRDMTFLGGALETVRFHHERWTGGGYPEGLIGERIPVIARIMAVADTFDTMTSDRPYRLGMPLEIAIQRLKDAAGSQFWPPAVDALLDLLDESAVTGWHLTHQVAATLAS